MPDRRVARTQKLLREALHSLIREKDYDSIVVKEILDRAEVGRSAFYMHFRDKDDLLASSIHDILGSVPSDHSKAGDHRDKSILAFGLPIFEHLDRHRRSGGLRLGPRGRAVLHAHLQRVLIELITQSVKGNLERKRKTTGPIPQALLVQFVASTFILVLNWWLDYKSPLSPAEANSIFQTLVRPTLVAADIP